jgi:hypothetical protein
MSGMDMDWFQPFSWVNIALLVLLFMTVIFSLLVFRQARQMTQVLPTPMSPTVSIAVVVYILATCTAFALGLGIVMSF